MMAEPYVIDDYESLPSQSVLVHMTAGAFAGIGEHCLMYPLDSVKTRMQSLCESCPERKSKTAIDGLISLVRREGIMRTLRGVNAVAAGAVPAHALYFSVYEQLKHVLTKGQNGHHPLAHGAAGIGATVAHDAIMNPAEVVKQRLQMFGSPYSSSVQCVRLIYQEEGLRAFYRSYGTQLILNIPFQCVHFMAYESGQHYLNPDHVYNPWTHGMAGAFAGGLAAAITTPLDVCKTVLNTQELQLQKHSVSGLCPKGLPLLPQVNCPATLRGLPSAVKTIYELRGFSGFYSGLGARVLFQMPATAIAWSVYELFKFLLDVRQVRSSSAKSTVAISADDTRTTKLV